MKLIFQDTTSVTLEKLKAVGLPEDILQDFTRRGEIIIKEKVEKLFESPFFDIHIGKAEEIILLSQLQELLNRKLCYPKEIVKDILQFKYSSLLEQWQAQPIDIAKDVADVERVSEEIFKRTTAFAPSASAGGEFSFETIATVCDMSGLPLIAEAVMVEKELGAKSLNQEQLTLLIRRSLMLKEHLSGITPRTETEPTVKKSDESQLPPTTVKKVSIKTEPGKVLKEKSAVSQVETKPAKPSIKRPTKPLSAILLSDENLVYFIENLYDQDEAGYRKLVEKLDRQPDLKRTLTETRNEFFVLDVAETSEAALRLIDIIEKYFGG
jgi:hypothetical protein